MSTKKVNGVIIPRRLKWSTSAGGEGMNSTPSPSGGGIAFFALALNAATDYSKSCLPEARADFVDVNCEEVEHND